MVNPGKLRLHAGAADAVAAADKAQRFAARVRAYPTAFRARTAMPMRRTMTRAFFMSRFACDGAQHQRGFEHIGI